MLAVDLVEGRLYGEEEIIDRLAGLHPYDRWLSNTVDLEAEIAPGPEELLQPRGTVRRQAAAGMTLEDLELILAPMAEEGKEAIGSMGRHAARCPVGRLPPAQPLLPAELQPGDQPADRPATRDPGHEPEDPPDPGNVLAEDETQTDVFVRWKARGCPPACTSGSSA